MKRKVRNWIEGSFIVGLTLIVAALVTKNPRNLYFSFALNFCLIIYFRSACFSYYLYACRLIYEAADALWKESVDKIASITSNIVEQVGLKPDHDLCMADTSPAELETSNRPAKGTIILFLRDELIKKECGRPNIHRGDIHITIKRFAYESGCQPRNILKQVQSCMNRNSNFIPHFTRRVLAKAIRGNGQVTSRKIESAWLPATPRRPRNSCGAFLCLPGSPATTCPLRAIAAASAIYRLPTRGR